MNELLRLALEAHGGLDRWNELARIRAHVSVGGTMWGRKGQAGTLADTWAEIETRQQVLTYAPFKKPGWTARFEPEHCVIESGTDGVLGERYEPRASFVTDDPAAAWDDIHVAYFGGYAMWCYLTFPFSLTWPGFRCEELAVWREAGEEWRRLRVEFPEGFAAHSRVQIFYFDSDDGLLRRHDYAAEVVGGMPSAHYSGEYKTSGGLVFPSARRVVPRKSDGTALPDPVFVSIDVFEVECLDGAEAEKRA